MYKAAILKSDFKNPAPTAKEIQDYLKKAGKLVYGNDKRKSKNTPFTDSIHSVMYAFDAFHNLITGEERQYHSSYTLYVFDANVNEMYFFLKYAERVVTHFLLTDAIIDDMHHCNWSYGHLTRYKNDLKNNAGFSNFMIEKGIGNANLYKAASKFSAATNAYITKIDDAIRDLEESAIALFKSGW